MIPARRTTVQHVAAETTLAAAAEAGEVGGLGAAVATTGAGVPGVVGAGDGDSWNASGSKTAETGWKTPFAVSEG